MNADVKASGNIIRLDNIVNGIALELQKQEEYLQSINADIKEAKAAADAEFPQEQELAEKEKRLAEVDALLSSTDVHADNGKDLYAALIEICPELEQSGEVYCKLEKGADSGIEPFIIERSGDTVFVAHTYVQNGDLMYDPAIEFSFDTKNETAHALTYEFSGMGIYKDLRGDENNAERSDIEEMALNTLFENVKAYDYEVKELRVGEEEQEEEIDYSQER